MVVTSRTSHMTVEQSEVAIKSAVFSARSGLESTSTGPKELRAGCSKSLLR